MQSVYRDGKTLGVVRWLEEVTHREYYNITLRICIEEAQRCVNDTTIDVFDITNITF